MTMAAKNEGVKKMVRGATIDTECLYATAIDPRLEQWRVLAAEWLATMKEGKAAAMESMKIFLVDYVHGQALDRDPAKFLSANNSTPCLYDSYFSHFKTKKEIIKRYGKITDFVNYVLRNYFSVDDDNGNAIISPAFRNPIPPLPESVDAKHTNGNNNESNKPVLPHYFITRLRHLLCPAQAKSFVDWSWAQSAEEKSGWFVVPANCIDKTDPDCVWRCRTTSQHERNTYGYGESVHEMWNPVRAVALYLKLQLPLRTFQVRMLDSGEADTRRYVKGEWVKNKNVLAKGNDRNPCRRGVFRQMTDDIKHRPMTGLFVNTNKTADRGKDEWSKGYSIPWEHHEVLYWLEKLRDWQEKYNPISAPMAWTDLERKHLGHAKADVQLKAMGATCFLFRDAAAQGTDKAKPIAVTNTLDALWYKLLATLEHQCEAEQLRDLADKPLIFVRKDTQATTYYPLHSLRVSLITAYALEGGVPMAILSKCIAGHARLVMTLYYTKAGITYCTETMDAATKRLMVDEQENYARWLKDKTYQQLEAHGAYQDPAAISAMMLAMQNGGASLTKDDKGFCPKGGWGCDSGGVYVNEDTGKVTYGEVPGYPQKNCPRCRWFFTGPAFLDGLNNHWNNIQLQMGDVGERIVKLEGQIAALEDELFECQENGLLFMEHDKLNTLRKVHQSEYEKNNKYAEDSSATFRLIARCTALAKSGPQDDGVQLVAVGGLKDVRVAVEECSKLRQVLTAVAGSTVYPEHDVSKAVLQAGKAFDMMLARNGKAPVLFRLPDDEFASMIQHITRLLIAEAGSIKDALPFIEGARKLAELGLDLNMEQLAQEMASSHVVQWDAAQRFGNSEKGRPALPYVSPKDAEEEDANVAE
ncbi:integrase family protein [Paraburkholderia sp. FT54]|uniref:gamma-mobile-trio integrase GmtZ n=1 Tax=Paraburkholderia sp. FT54 TaxID=3074437 RepID=UPI0028778C64|nr:integrase family protein [Paraburkholderia sp. FT54]WNC89443.1 integrase family protein [Paraburkholderia sp. FT54]